MEEVDHCRGGFEWPICAAFLEVVLGLFQSGVDDSPLLGRVLIFGSVDHPTIMAHTPPALRHELHRAILIFF
jgi:hypothetical protein